MDEIAIHLGGSVILCGDFNAHSSLWGHCNNENGLVTEELMESKNMVCLNDGSGTRINIRNGTVSNRPYHSFKFTCWIVYMACN